MTQYSKQERIIASFLSTMPGLKAFLKKIYVSINYLIHKKNYRLRILNSQSNIQLIEPTHENDETFFGYYDKSPENDRGMILFNETGSLTSKKPNIEKPIWLNILTMSHEARFSITESFSYNWQQGCRAQWLSNNNLIYNFFDVKHKRYNSALYSVEDCKVINCFDFPVQDAFHEEYFLAVNYQRIMRLRPDYGYRNLPLMNNEEMKNLKKDGIWKVDLKSGQTSLIVSLEDVIRVSPHVVFQDSLHKLNHVMISPNGTSFIFIHRWYHQSRRFDRLMLYRDGKLTLIADDMMVSHMCWINEKTLFGYLRHGGSVGFYFIDLLTGMFRACDDLNLLNNGDGHPSCFGDWIVIDSYPDKSRMQHLTLYNYQQKVVIPLLELFQPLKYQGECRCDLHPRFSPDGCRIYFDTVFTGKRRLGYMDVSSLIN